MDTTNSNGVEQRKFSARSIRSSVDAAKNRNASRIRTPAPPNKEIAARRRAGTTALKLPPVVLTSREHQALRLFAMGYRTEQVGQHLGITTHTVRAHVKHVRYKLSASSTLQAVVTAQKLGMI